MAFTTRDGRTQTVLAEINMIPFIDIMLVLLIIFMITAPVIQSGIEVNVPQTKKVDELTKDLLTITIDRKEELYLQNVPIRISDLAPEVRKRLSATKAESTYVRADANVTWKTATRVIDELKQGGIENIVIVTQPIARR